MLLFLSIFFFLYSLMHFYLFGRAKSALVPGTGLTLLFALFLMAMIVSPIVIRLLESAGWSLAARLVAYVGYTWMGMLFLFVCTSLVIDVYRIAAYIAAHLAGDRFSFLVVGARTSFLLCVAAATVVGTYGWFEARSIRNDTITIATPKIPAHVDRLRIAQISDIHLGLVVRDNRLKEMLAVVRRAQPDIIVSTGDLVDGQMEYHEGAIELFRSLAPRYGKFAVTGNHEFYAGLNQALDFTRQAGFKVLRGERIVIDDVITIAGVDDPAGPGYGSSSKGERALLASGAQNGNFTLLLKHRPAIDAESLGLFDLQLSGHVHKGQIFPFRLITRFFYPFISGLHVLPQQSLLYVNRGTGTWGPPIRFLAPPEVTIIDLVRPQQPADNQPRGEATSKK